jgi:preprotein translocase subunit SecA
MIGKLISGISNIFGGNKTDRDRKEIEPIVVQINEYFQSYATISNDELRNKTNEFIERINVYLADIDTEIAAAKNELKQTPEEETDVRDGLFHRLDELEKGRDSKLEEILAEI